MTTPIITYRRSSYSGPGAVVASCRDSVFASGDSVLEADIGWFAYQDGALVKSAFGVPEFAVTVSPGSWRLICLVKAGADVAFQRADEVFTVEAPAYDLVAYYDPSAGTNGVEGLGLLSDVGNPFNDIGTVQVRALEALTDGGQVHILCKSNETLTTDGAFLTFPEGLRGRVVVESYGGAPAFTVDSTYNGPFIACPGELGLHVTNLDFIGSFNASDDQTAQTAIARVRKATDGGQWDLTLKSVSLYNLGTKAIDMQVLSGIPDELSENATIFTQGWRDTNGQLFVCDDVTMDVCHTGLGFVPMSWSAFLTLNVTNIDVGYGLRILSGYRIAIYDSIFDNYVDGADPMFMVSSVTDPTSDISVAQCQFYQQPPIFAEFTPGESWPTSETIANVHFVNCIVSVDEADTGIPARGDGAIDWKVYTGGVIRNSRFATSTKRLFCSTASKGSSDIGSSFHFETNSVLSTFATDSFDGVINLAQWMRGVNTRNNVVQSVATGAPTFLSGSGLSVSAISESDYNLLYIPNQDAGVYAAIGFSDVLGGGPINAATWSGSAGFGSNSTFSDLIAADPKFIDIASPNFDLGILVGSACIGGGTEVLGALVTIGGILRTVPYDIGSFQSGAEASFADQGPSAPGIAEGSHGTDYVEIALSVTSGSAGHYDVEQDGELLETVYYEAGFPIQVPTAESVDGTTTQIRVRYVDEEGFESAWSNTLNPTTVKIALLEAPAAFLYSRANTTLDLAFTTVPGATAMEVSRAPIADPENWTVVSSVVDPGTSPYQFTGLAGATGYRLRIAGKNSGGTGPATIIEECYTLPAAPTQPTMSILYQGTDHIRVVIGSDGTQAGYIATVEWSGHAVSSVDDLIPGNATEFVFSGLPEATSITMHLYARNEASLSAVRTIVASTKDSAIYDTDTVITEITNQIGVRRLRGDFVIGGASNPRAAFLRPLPHPETKKWMLYQGELTVSGACAYWMGSSDLVANITQIQLVVADTYVTIDRELPFAIGAEVALFIQGSDSTPSADDYYAVGTVLYGDTIKLTGVEFDTGTTGIAVINPVSLVRGVIAAGASVGAAIAAAGVIDFPAFAADTGKIPFICISTAAQTIAGYVYADESL